MVVRIEVDATKAFNKLNRLGKDIKKSAEDSVLALADIGKRHAKSIAPNYSGKLARLIRVVAGTGSKGLYAQVISPNPVTNDGHKRSIAKFDLVKWMHLTNGIGYPAYIGSDGQWYANKKASKRRVISGDAQYMFTTRDYMSKEKKKIADAQFARIRTKYS